MVDFKHNEGGLWAAPASHPHFYLDLHVCERDARAPGVHLRYQSIIKLPSEYPPELPAKIAGNLYREMDEVRPDSALLFGANIPHEHVKSIIDSCSKRKLSPDHEEIGFSFVERGDKRILIYSLPEIGYPDYLENLSLVLHVFRMLGLETVAIINAVHYIKQDPPPIVLITDHVNLTGINPLDYWMMPYEP